MFHCDGSSQLNRETNFQIISGTFQITRCQRRNFCPLISTQESSTPLFTSGARPLLETPVDGTVTEGETKEAVVSTQSMVHRVSTSSTTKDAYLLGDTETGEDTVATFLWFFSILRCSKEIQ